MAISTIVRALVIQLLYVVYLVVLFVRLGKILEHVPTYKHHWTVIAGVLLNLLHLIAQCYLLRFYVHRYVDYDSDDEDETHPTWVNIPMFVFVAFSLGPFGMCLHYQYKILKPALKDNHASCSEIPTIPQFSFVLFHIGIILLVISHMVYPYPQRRMKTSERIAVTLQFLDVFDIMDIVENITCFQTYPKEWLAIFYFSLAVSSIHLAFPIGVTEEDEKDPIWGRIFSSFITLVCTDIMFAVLRVQAMKNQKTIQQGFNFLSKNTLAATIRFFLIAFYIYKEAVSSRSK